MADVLTKEQVAAHRKLVDLHCDCPDWNHELCDSHEALRAEVEQMEVERDYWVKKGEDVVALCVGVSADLKDYTPERACQFAIQALRAERDEFERIKVEANASGQQWMDRAIKAEAERDAALAAIGRTRPAVEAAVAWFESCAGDDDNEPLPLGYTHKLRPLYEAVAAYHAAGEGEAVSEVLTKEQVPDKVGLFAAQWINHMPPYTGMPCGFWTGQKAALADAHNAIAHITTLEQQVATLKEALAAMPPRTVTDNGLLCWCADTNGPDHYSYCWAMRRLRAAQRKKGSDA